ncbi:fibronectin type III domain-containing protein [Nonomuraea sp. NPDC001636]|uniref:fibronectin type III domain-containing protein n=1 Tax=Nonomuraea sp. NPDC001636 TaxID=3154391 RepID=UPI00332B0ABF
MIKRLLLSLVLLLGALPALGARPAAASPGTFEPPGPDTTVASAAALAPGPGQYFSARVRVLSNIAIAAGATSTVKVTGVGTVPASGVASVAVNVAAKGASAAGAVVVYPSELSAAPGVTGARYRSGVWDDHLLMVKTGTDGSVKVKNTGTAAVNVYLDIHGYTTSAAAASAGASYVPLNTSRIIGNQSVPANSTASYAAVGVGGIPAGGVAFVALTLIVKSTGSGRVTAYPSGSAAPAGSNIDYRPSSFLSNLVIVAPGPDGKITINNAGAAALTVYADVAGYFAAPAAAAATSALTPLAPARIVTNVSVAAGADYTVAPLGKAGVPASGVSGVVVDVSAKSTVGGLLRLFPTGQSSIPGGGSIAFQANDFWANVVPVRLGTNGTFVVRNTATAAIALSVDTYAYFKAPVAPDAPSSVTASPTDGGADVAWKAPADGGASISTYTVTVSPGGARVSSTTTSVHVSGLTNGSAYVFTVTARNAAGTSPASAPSEPVTPAAPRTPGTPLITAVTARDAAVKVDWSPPDTGTAGIVKYAVTASPGNVSVEAAADATQATVGGLTNGTAYTFVVTAVNGTGSGSPSAPSQPVTPAPATTPLRPPVLSVVALDQKVEIQWAEPPDGGAAISGYHLTAEPGGLTLDTPAATTVATFTGLTNGTAYTFTVAARNAAGTGEAETAGPATPAAQRAPVAPAGVTASTTADGSVKVTWNAPRDTGTAPITSYTVTASPGGATATAAATATSAVVSGLDVATAYTFTVRAANQYGASPESAASQSVLPKVTAKATPVVLSAASLARLIAVGTDGTLDFDSPPAQVTGLTAGTYVVAPVSANTPRGLFRKVTAVTTRGALVSVMTQEAAIPDVVGDGDVAFDTVTDASGVQFTPLAPGVRAVRPTQDGKPVSAAGGPGSIGLRDGALVVEVATKAGPAGHDDVGRKLEMWMTLAPHGHGKIHLKGGTLELDHFGASVNVALNSVGKIGAMAEWQRKWLIGRMRTPCIDLQLGPLPVLICPEFDVYVQFEVDGSLGIAFQAGYSREVGATVTLQGGDLSMDKIDIPGRQNHAELIAYGDAGAKISFPFEEVMYIYGAAGPGASFAPYVQVIADTTQNPWLELRVGLTLGGFMKTRSLFGKALSIRKDDLVNWWYSAWHSGPFTGIEIDPAHVEGGPNTAYDFDFKVTGIPEITAVQWSVITGPGTIDQNGTYTSPSYGHATIQAYSPANGTRPPQYAEAEITICDCLPGPPQNAVARPGPLQATVSWTAPAPVPGSPPVDGYAVVTDPPSGTRYTKETQVVVNQLKPGVMYTIWVYAHNFRGYGEASQPTAVMPTRAMIGFGAPVNVAVDADGNPDTMNFAGSWGSKLSADGRYVFFAVRSGSNLAPNEVYQPNGNAIYLVRKDLQTGEIILVSRGGDGRTPSYIPITVPGTGMATNRDGSIVAYIGDRNAPFNSPAIIVRNLRTGQVWVEDPGVAYEDFDTMSLRLSEDGTVIAVRVGLTTDAPPPREATIYRGVVGQPLTRVDTVCVAKPGCHTNNYFGLTRDGVLVWYGVSLTAFVGTLQVYNANSGTTVDLHPNATEDDHFLKAMLSGDGSTIAAFYAWGTETTSGQGLVIKPVNAGRIVAGDILISSKSNVDPEAINRNGRVVVYSELYDAGGSTRTRYKIYDLGAGGPTVTIPSISSLPYVGIRPQLDDDGGLLVWTLDTPDLDGVYAWRY